MTHTPGPWHVYAKSLYEHEVLAGNEIVAGLFALKAGYDVEAANARLIAAAPDLLNAARLMLSYQPNALRLLAEAVAKAEGREP